MMKFYTMNANYDLARLRVQKVVDQTRSGMLFPQKPGIRRYYDIGTAESSIDSADKLRVSVFSEPASISMPMNFESVIHHTRGQL